MNTHLLLTVILFLTSIGPIIGAVAIYHDNITWLVVPPSTQAAIDDLQKVKLCVAYTGYGVVNAARELRLFFDVTNPYNINISITDITIECYCHEHGTHIGKAEGEELPLQIPQNGTRRLSMMLTFTGEGKNDVILHYEASENMFLDIRDVVAVMQGVGAQFTGDLADVGPISLS